MYDDLPRWATALVAFEKGNRRLLAIIDRLLARREQGIVPAGVAAQVWRGGRKQARLARLLGSPLVQVEPLDERGARIAGQLCGLAGTANVVDASVVACARAHRNAVVTSDARYLRRLDPAIRLIEV